MGEDSLQKPLRSCCVKYLEDSLELHANLGCCVSQMQKASSCMWLHVCQEECVMFFAGTGRSRIKINIKYIILQYWSNMNLPCNIQIRMYHLGLFPLQGHANQQSRSESNVQSCTTV